MAESIYTVKDWVGTTPYLKNNIVLIREDIGDTGIPKKIKYYYASKSRQTRPHQPTMINTGPDTLTQMEPLSHFLHGHPPITSRLPTNQGL